MLDKLWDDVVAGPQPDRGLGKLRKPAKPPQIIVDSDVGESSGNGMRSAPVTPTPTTPVTPVTPTDRQRHSVWRSVFNPGSNLATRNMGADIFDKPQPNSPTVYDWLYSGDTKSPHL